LKNADNSPIYSVIDVGTNNILLLIATSGAKLEIIYQASATSALGKEMKDDFLQPQAISRAKNILTDYINYSRKFTNQIIIIGTSCSREAKNISELSEWLMDEYKINYQIISGEQEAHLNGLANLTEFSQNQNLLLFDVGGGSTEFTLIQAGKIQQTITTPIGIRRYINRFDSEFAMIKQQLLTDLTGSQLQLPEQITLVGIGGTACSLAAMKHRLETYQSEVVHRSFISSADIVGLQLDLQGKTASELVEKMPFDVKRAEIILIGLHIVKEIVAFFQGGGFFVSDRGLQFGVLRQNENELAKML